MASYAHWWKLFSAEEANPLILLFPLTLLIVVESPPTFLLYTYNTHSSAGAFFFPLLFSLSLRAAHMSLVYSSLLHITLYFCCVCVLCRRRRAFRVVGGCFSLWSLYFSSCGSYKGQHAISGQYRPVLHANQTPPPSPRMSLPITSCLLPTFNWAAKDGRVFWLLQFWMSTTL